MEEAVTVGPTGTSDRPREGVCIIRRFLHAQGTTYLAIQRIEGGRWVTLTCTPEVSDRLLERYGWNETESFISVSPIIGARARYRETGTGMLTHLDLLEN
jgi:hypothetical protein